jgi:SAM-dependent methyltransferase
VTARTVLDDLRVEPRDRLETAERPLLQTCLLCGSAKLHYAFALQDLRVVRCADCEILALNPQPGDRELAALQAGGRQHARSAPMPLELIDRYRGSHGGRLFEVGCRQGEWLTDAARAGYDVVGLESIASAARIARERLGAAGRVICGDVTAIRAGSRRFDVCVLTDVIQFARQPRLFLETIRGLLVSGGTLCLTTPALDSSPARPLPAQLVYFDRNTIQSMLLSAGFEEIYLAPDSLTVCARARQDSQDARLSVIVPVYNEARTVGRVLETLLAKRLPRVEIEVIVVESHSTDGSREAVLAYRDHPRVTVVLEDRPRGKGHAVRAGLARARGDFVLIQDADLEYDFEDYDVLLEPLITWRRAFVLGSRHGGSALKMRQFADQPALSVFLNLGHWFFTTLVNVLFRLRLKDPFTMFKVFRRDCLFGLEFSCNRFDFDYELLIKLVRKGYRPIEIPVNYRSRSFKDGKKVSMFHDPLLWLRALLRLRFTPIEPLTVIERLRSRTSPSEQELHR